MEKMAKLGSIALLLRCPSTTIRITTVTEIIKTEVLIDFIEVLSLIGNHLGKREGRPQDRTTSRETKR